MSERPPSIAPESEPESSAQTRCGYVALIGAPNAGKSTLLNCLVGSKVAIVSPKVQTTRTRVLGITIEGAAQLIFVDTPGIFTPKRRLERAMVAAAWEGADDADVVVLLVDSSARLKPETLAIAERLREYRRPAILALNKVDAVKPPVLLELAERLNQAGRFAETFMISALTGSGVDDLRRSFAMRVPEGPWLFPEDQLSDMPERLLAAEITREKLFLRLQQELPYSLTVETESWEELEDGSARIGQVIYVQRESQKPIVLGRGGSMIKSVGIAARRELEEILERRIHLSLYVKVRENWIDDPERYRDWGLDYNS
jgi:GTP-binding protein Era